MKHHSARSDSCGTRHAQRLSNTSHLINIGPVPFSPSQYARAVLLGYAERYSSYPYHDANCKTGKSASASGGHLFEQTLNEAACLAGEIGPAYDLVYDSEVFSAADHDKIRTGLFLPILRNIDKHKAGKGNWQTWHNAAMFVAAPLVGNVEWARKAIAQPGNGFVHQMEVSVSKDGLWYENSWGYHFYTLRAMVPDPVLRLWPRQPPCGTDTTGTAAEYRVSASQTTRPVAFRPWPRVLFPPCICGIKQKNLAGGC